MIRGHYPNSSLSRSIRVYGGFARASCSTRRNGAIAPHRAARLLRRSARAIDGTRSRSSLRRAQHRKPAVRVRSPLFELAYPVLGPTLLGAPKLRFAVDSPLEGDGFEP